MLKLPPLIGMSDGTSSTPVAGFMRLTSPSRLSPSQIAPSGPAAIPAGLLPPKPCDSPFSAVFAGFIHPTAPPDDAFPLNQIRLSGPTVMLNGSEKPVGTSNSSITGGFPGVTLPILLMFFSVNQSLPSGPCTMSCGNAPAVGISNSVTVGAAAAGAASRSRSRSGVVLSQCLIQSLVDEFVGSGVVLAAHRADGPFVETAQLSHGLGKQMLKTGMFHLVLPADLTRDELGVVHDLDLLGAKLAGELEPQQQRPVLGHVVRGLPDVELPLAERLALRARRDGGHRGRAGVSARPAVHVDDHPH